MERTASWLGLGTPRRPSSAAPSRASSSAIFSTKSRPSASLEDVAASARWGDVLLFRCRMPHTVLIRTLTVTSFDHVGVVVHNVHGDLFMLEACVLGVRAFPLEQRVREYAEHYADVVCWRRLLCDRSTEATAAAVRFLEEVDGLKYSCTPPFLPTSERALGPWREECRVVTAQMIRSRSSSQCDGRLPIGPSASSAPARLSSVSSSPQRGSLIAVWPRLRPSLTATLRGVALTAVWLRV
jgi:hypothetical protein